MAKILVSIWFFSFTLLGFSQSSQQPIREKVIRTAESQLYVKEATGHNDGTEVETYLALTGLPKGYAWCAAFVSWVYKTSGVKTTISALARDFFKTNVIYNRSTTLDKTWLDAGKQGDVIGLWYNNLGRIGHIAIITGGDKNNYYTIEGNTNKAGDREGQGVEKKIRPKSMIYAIADHIKE